MFTHVLNLVRPAVQNAKATIMVLNDVTDEFEEHERDTSVCCLVHFHDLLSYELSILLFGQYFIAGPAEHPCVK